MNGKTSLSSVLDLGGHLYSPDLKVSSGLASETQFWIRSSKEIA